VSWNETNVPHEATIGVEDADGATLLSINAGFTVGRPPALPPGSQQLTTIAVNVDIVFPKPGEYRLVAHIAEGQLRSVPFRVHNIPPPGHIAAA
jgi:hypothetical protein